MKPMRTKNLSFLVFILGMALAACGGGTPGPTAIPVTNLPWTDDFGKPSGWSAQSDTSAEAKYDNGAFRIIVKQENLTVWSVAGKNISDGAYTVDAAPNGGPKDNGFGVVFRFKDRKNFYHFEISSDGYWRAGMMKDGKWENWDDWAPHPGIKQGNGVNKIRVVMKGDSFTYFVNNQQIFQKTDKSFAGGDVGVFALSLIDAPGTDISFDNASVVAEK